ncbi:MAG: BatD family protein, partial [Pseudomonadota bacterium]
MVRVLCLLLAAGLVLPVATLAQDAASAVAVELDRNPVNANESFTATFTIEGNWRITPDFAPLTEDFEILQQSQSSSVQMGAGGTTMQQTWVLTLLPRRAGTLELPALAFGTERSAPVAVEVLPATALTPADKDTLVEVSVEPQSVYVQQQVLVTVRAMRAGRITGQSLSPLSLSGVDTVTESLVDNRTYQSRRGGRVYNVHEFAYAVFPQASGTLFVDPLKYEVEVPGQRWRSKIQRVFSDAAEVAVRPVPATFSGSVWLPSTDVQLKEQWPTEPPMLRAGDAVTRTLVLSAAGLTAVQLPPLDAVAPAAFKQYADQPVLENGATERGVIGMRKEQVAMLPTQPGPFTLPAVEVKWWDTEAGLTRVARLPERVVEVLPGAGALNPQSLTEPGLATAGRVLETAPLAAPGAGPRG